MTYAHALVMQAYGSHQLYLYENFNIWNLGISHLAEFVLCVYHEN